jgi:PIN domain nuclease of toxin-antitoxin system
VIEGAERGETVLVVSAIALAEMYYSDQKFGLFTDFEQVCARLFALPYYRFEPFTPEDALDLARDPQVPEMHDRIIYGLARRLRLPLVSKDPAMRQTGEADVVW